MLAARIPIEKEGLKRLSTLLAVIGMVLLTFPGASEADDSKDAALVEELVANSPYKGTSTVMGVGTWGLDLAFSKSSQGKLEAEIKNAPSRFANPNGPVSNLTVKDGTVKFQSPTGAHWSLQVDSAGNLVGKSINRENRDAAFKFVPRTNEAASALPK
jgi:hypothetical protein